MTSVILELLETAGEGSYLHGKLCFPEWAPEVRRRVQSKFVSALRASAPVQLRLMDSVAAIPGDSLRTTESQVLEMDGLASRIGNLMYVSPRSR